VEQFGQALGYRAANGEVSRHIRRLESGTRKVPRAIERLALMFLWHGVPKHWRVAKV